jgi:hypothetical protein
LHQTQNPKKRKRKKKSKESNYNQTPRHNRTAQTKEARTLAEDRGGLTIKPIASQQEDEPRRPRTMYHVPSG